MLKSHIFVSFLFVWQLLLSQTYSAPNISSFVWESQNRTTVAHVNHQSRPFFPFKEIQAIEVSYGTESSVYISGIEVKIVTNLSINSILHLSEFNLLNSYLITIFSTIQLEELFPIPKDPSRYFNHTARDPEIKPFSDTWGGIFDADTLKLKDVCDTPQFVDLFKHSYNCSVSKIQKMDLYVSNLQMFSCITVSEESKNLSISNEIQFVNSTLIRSIDNYSVPHGQLIGLGMHQRISYIRNESDFSYILHILPKSCFVDTDLGKEQFVYQEYEQRPFGETNIEKPSHQSKQSIVAVSSTKTSFELDLQMRYHSPSFQKQIVKLQFVFSFSEKQGTSSILFCQLKNLLSPFDYLFSRDCGPLYPSQVSTSSFKIEIPVGSLDDVFFC
eukprot:TRINITY_DN3108_c0_g1_i1.p1 TRINITY_DN3108_c0_g1~~TRINITY_DN3108_c0_g1_i1.p1  ORF type:complete len:386 (-),score=4.95 TRINITY_DN3108_c0_g1_i1:61-1218(-)